jgi:hypothetical protein
MPRRVCSRGGAEGAEVSSSGLKARSNNFVQRTRQP